MRRNIVFLTDNIFLKKDFERFDLDFLSKKFDVQIFNFSKLTNPFFFKNLKKLSDKKYKKFNIIESYEEFEKILSQTKYNFAYDFMGISENAWKIRNILRNKNILLIKNFSADASIPKQINKTLIKRIYDNFYPRKQLGGSIFRKFKNRLILYNHKNFKWDLGVFFGDESFNVTNKRRCKKYIKSHTFDFDKYIKLFKNKSKINKEYFVFIDNNIARHPDYKYHGTKPPVNEQKYLNDLINFFNSIEKKTNIKIIIAANPKSKHKKDIFGKRKILYNKTAELIQNSNGVFLHNSTAVNFAILFKKPLFFLTSNHIKESWIHEGIYLMAKSLNKKVININLFEPHDKINFSIDYKAYQKFKTKYIKCLKTKNIFSWEILNKYLKVI